MRDKFIRFLKDNHAWDEYVKAFEDFRPNGALDVFFKKNKDSPSLFLHAAFPFVKETAEGMRWLTLAKKWEETL